jgi:hypothetical protein
VITILRLGRDSSLFLEVHSSCRCSLSRSLVANHLAQKVVVDSFLAAVENSSVVDFLAEGAVEAKNRIVVDFVD